MFRLFVITLCLAISNLAFGHAQLLEIIPADGSRLDNAPAKIELIFNEAVQPIHFRLLDDQRQELQTASDLVMAKHFVVTLPELSNGHYIFSYRVSSLDGHPIFATTTFQLGNAPTFNQVQASQPAVPESESSTSKRLAAITLFFVLLSIGLFLYRKLVDATPWRGDNIIQLIALPLVVYSLLAFLPYYSGMGLSIYSKSSPLMGLLGQKVVIGQLLFALGFLAFVISIRASRNALALLGIFAVVLGKTFAGHTLTTSYLPTASIMLLTHLLIVAFWLAALLRLERLATSGSNQLGTALENFSRRALPAVVLLIVTGIGMALLIVDTWGELLQHRYGQLLLIKISLVAVICLLALLNKQALTPRILRGEVAAVGKLKNSIRLEGFLLVVVFLVTSVLAVTSPMAKPMVAAVTEQHLSVESAGYQLELDYLPQVEGRMTLQLQQNGIAFDAMEMHLNWRDSDGLLEPLQRQAEGAPVFVSALPPFSNIAWTLEIDVLIDDFTSLRFETQIAPY